MKYLKIACITCIIFVQDASSMTIKSYKDFEKNESSSNVELASLSKVSLIGHRTGIAETLEFLRDPPDGHLRKYRVNICAPLSIKLNNDIIKAAINLQLAKLENSGSLPNPFVEELDIASIAVRGLESMFPCSKSP